MRVPLLGVLFPFKYPLFNPPLLFPTHPFPYPPPMPRSWAVRRTIIVRAPTGTPPSVVPLSLCFFFNRALYSTETTDCSIPAIWRASVVFSFLVSSPCFRIFFLYPERNSGGMGSRFSVPARRLPSYRRRPDPPLPFPLCMPPNPGHSAPHSCPTFHPAPDLFEMMHQGDRAVS
jgi:hypothetical protein